jgi:diacylglycerol kinase (ATP)
MPQTWLNKFRVAIAGLLWAIRDQNSFHVHGIVSVLVLLTAAQLRLQFWQWTTLVLAIGLVFTAELLNTAIEQLVAVLHPNHDLRIGRVLDIAAAAVLLATLTAVAVGALVLGPSLYDFLATRP